MTRHWRGAEELSETYWSDQSTQERRAQEFVQKPVDGLAELQQIEQIAEGAVARRDFLTVMGATMAMASFACARRPVHKIIPYVVPPEAIVPGNPTYYTSACPECAQGCGLIVKNREGRPIKLEGNPDHPVNRGSLCARGQASLLSLYDPERAASPGVMDRQNPNRSVHAISWKQADEVISARLRDLARRGNARVRVLTPELSSPTLCHLIQDFLKCFDQGAHVEYNPLAADALVNAQALAYGTPSTLHHHFDRANFVLSFGSDFLGNGSSPLEDARNWATGRKLFHQLPRSAKMNRLVCFETMLSLTGANSDQRFAVLPGQELNAALGVLSELLPRSGQYTSQSQLRTLLTEFSADRVATDLGIAGGGAVFREIADRLWSERGRSVVIGGSVAAQSQNALGLQVAVSLLNSLLGNEGVTVQAGEAPAGRGFGAMAALIQQMRAGEVDALIIDRANPMYSLPHLQLELKAAIAKVPLVVVLGEQMHETGMEADYFLPANHYLETWGDVAHGSTVSIQQPAVRPIGETRSLPELLLGWKAAAGDPVASSGGSKEWYTYLRDYWRSTFYARSKAAGSFEQFWDATLRRGLFEDAQAATKPPARSFRSEAFSALRPQGLSGRGPYLALYPKLSMGDGRMANNAWLQEMPDPISAITWDNYLNVSPALARKLQLTENDVVDVRTTTTHVELPVHIQPGLHEQLVTAAIGYGRRVVGKVGTDCGIDLFPLVHARETDLQYAGLSIELRKTGRVFKLASTQWHTATENRPIINDLTLEEFRKDPATSSETDPEIRLKTIPTIWNQHEFPIYHWGMSVDLNSCIGCGSCVIACQAENNIPVVGRNQVRVARQMHWIRIDRYYSGAPEAPDVVFQPMMCQHCENAPCEAVCPVIATLHDDEGLNVQVYNRCVGTRYCQNNCPYKVRRFNFFDHWKAYSGSANLVWNPDVTVRTRGIMEKCTFCIQRITAAKDTAKDAGERVADGEVKTACQQTCPTEAIVFGNLNDPQSGVSLRRLSPQAFRVLEVLNTLPSVSYLSKVRNKEQIEARS